MDQNVRCFCEDAFCEVEIQAGEDAAVAKKLRELAEQVAAQGK
jgi:hypothetical protein